MFLAESFLIGSVLGWIISSALRTLTPSPPATQTSPQPPSKIRSIATLFVAIVLLVIFFLVAAGTDQGRLFNFVIKGKALVVGPRVQALLLGLVLGVVIQLQRRRAYRAIRRLGGAVIGDENQTAWVFQGAVVLALIAAMLLAIRPDFFDYLRSLKLGGFEATFSDRARASLLRDAHLNLRDFREQIALHQYKDFYATFLSEAKARGWARQLVMDNQLREQTNEITEVLAGYVDPIVDSLICLSKANALRAASRDKDLVRYEVLWENFLLKLHDGKLEITNAQMKTFLGGLSASVVEVNKHSDELDSGCTVKRKIKATADEDQANAEAIVKHYTKASKILSDKGFRDGKVQAIVVFEPYFAGAVSDLIALLSGDREKTDFLFKMMDGVPHSDEYLSPGIVNFYYQVADAWLNTSGPIPLEPVRSSIEFATTGADHIISMSRSKIKSLTRSGEKPNLSYCVFEGPVDSAAKGAAPPGDDPLNHTDKVVQIYDTFLRNLFATLTTEVDLYVQRALEGQPLTESYRLSWTNVTSRLSAMVQIREDAPTIGFDGLPRTDVDEFMKERLRLQTVNMCETTEPGPSKPRVKYFIDPDFMVQADLALALSSVLLNGESMPTAQACNTGLFFSNDAERWIEPTTADSELDKAQDQRLKQLVAAVAAQVVGRCASSAAAH
jgi:hypothetical protein